MKTNQFVVVVDQLFTLLYFCSVM